jgi:hypothetical protein
MYKCSVANNNNIKIIVGQDSVVGIATCYGVHGPGIESWWGLGFLHPSRPALWPTQLVPGLSWG